MVVCEADGSDRLEYWKQIVLKREYVYNRTVQVKDTAIGQQVERTTVGMTLSTKRLFR